MSHDEKIEFVGGVWDGQIISFGGCPPRTFLVPRQSKIQVLEYNITLGDLGSDEVVSVYILYPRQARYVFSHYQYAELFKNKTGQG